MGCWYHNHSCMNARSDSLKPDQKQWLAERGISTISRTEHLRSLGYIVHEMWECDAKKYFKANRNLMKKILKSPILSETPINPSDAIFGGRTEAFRLMCDEPAAYYDIISMYPYVQKYLG